MLDRLCLSEASGTWWVGQLFQWAPSSSGPHALGQGDTCHREEGAQLGFDPGLRVPRLILNHSPAAFLPRLRAGDTPPPPPDGWLLTHCDPDLQHGRPLELPQVQSLRPGPHRLSPQVQCVWVSYPARWCVLEGGAGPTPGPPPAAPVNPVQSVQEGKMRQRLQGEAGGLRVRSRWEG